MRFEFLGHALDFAADRANLLCDDGKATPVFAGPRRLDHGIQRENAHLPRHLLNPPRLLRCEPAHLTGDTRDIVQAGRLLFLALLRRYRCHISPRDIAV